MQWMFRRGRDRFRARSRTIRAIDRTARQSEWLFLPPATNAIITNLRVLHAIHDFLPRHPAGSEIYAFELCREQSARHDVTVVCAEYDPGRPHGSMEWRLHDGLPVIEIVNNWVCGSFEETYRSPLVSARLAHVLDTIQPDVVHVHNLLNLSLDFPAASRARGTPVVATLHDYSLVCPAGGQRVHRAERHVCRVIEPERCARCFKESAAFQHLSFGRLNAAAPAPRLLRRAVSGLLRRLPRLTKSLATALRRTPLLPVGPHHIENRLAAARDAMDHVDLFVAPSQSIADEFQRLGVDRARVRVRDYGFAHIRRSATAGRGDGPLRLGFVGTLAWHKGVHTLIDAVSGLPTDSWTLSIFGDPDVFPDYTGDLRRRAVRHEIRFMGPFERAQIADVFGQLDVLVVPSLWLENSPLVIHEAFMAGVPVVGARIGGIAELVSDGRNGLLYDPDSASELASRLVTLIDNRDYVRQLAAALPAVSTIEVDSREWEATYEDVVRRRRAQHRRVR